MSYGGHALCEAKGPALITDFLHGLCKWTREANGVTIVLSVYTVYAGKRSMFQLEPLYFVLYREVGTVRQKV